VPRYKIRVWDNFHYHDPDESWEDGVCDDAAGAQASCRKLIDSSLQAAY
jgi:hypothetical protein